MTRIWSVCAVIALITLSTKTARAECFGACGAGCGLSCNFVTEEGIGSCLPDGTYYFPVKTGYSCWTSPCCQFHDQCLQDAGCMACNLEAMACNAAAVGYYLPPNDGCWACAGPGFPYCDPHGYWGWFDENNRTETRPPGAAGNPCPSCTIGQGCPPPTDVCVGARDCLGLTCPCSEPPPNPCVGTCYPLCGQPDGCGNTCSNNDDVCYECGYTNACGRYCGDCPPPPPPPPTCDPTCYSCDSWNECGDYCGDCPYEYWCGYTDEGYCCWDNYGNYWCEWYYE